MSESRDDLWTDATFALGPFLSAVEKFLKNAVVETNEDFNRKVELQEMVENARVVTAGLENSVIYRSGKDGTLVVEITGEDAANPASEGQPRMRVYLNEGAIYENPEYPELEPGDD